MKSIRRHVLVTLLGALLAAGVLASAATYISARAEIGELLDEELRQVALSVRDYPPLDLAPLASPAVDPQHRVVVQVWNPAGRMLYLSNSRTPLPLSAQAGYVTLNHQGREWRMFTTFTGERVVQVAQPTVVRTAAAANAALRLLVPILAVLPLLGVLIWFLVGRGLEPLARLAKMLGGRSPTSLDPIPAQDLPEELAPLAASLNGLLGRLQEAFSVQRRFAADAAHELRTPLTALGLQIQLLERACTDAERAGGIERLRAGVRRATRLVQQLLILARLEPDAAEQPFGRVALNDIARTVVADFAPLAAAKSVTLTAEQMEPVTVSGGEESLGILASNFVDNAVRYTQAGGRVVVRVRRDGEEALLEVADNGPGIPADERERVFDRFYRGAEVTEPGSGLGLAIARQVADMHAGRIELAEGLDGAGLTARLRLPARRKF